MSSVLVVVCGEEPTGEVKAALRADGHRMLECAPARVGEALRRHAPVLVLVLAPHGDSTTFEVCRAVRAASTLPLVVLAGSGDEVDELMAFASGADEYVISGASTRVLRARLGAVLRRSSQQQNPSMHAVGDLVVDTEMRRVTVAGRSLHLTRIEFELLLALTENRHRVVPRSELIQRVWGPWPGDDHVVEVHLSRMRNKILAAGGPRIAEPSPGYGYRLGGAAARAV